MSGAGAITRKTVEPTVLDRLRTYVRELARSPDYEPHNHAARARMGLLQKRLWLRQWRAQDRQRRGEQPKESAK